MWSPAVRAYVNVVETHFANDTFLVRRAQAGDTAAFEGLYRVHVGRVYALCLRLTGDRMSAEELTQDAFVRAWERLDTFRGESAFFSWLYRLTVNVVLGERRANRRYTLRFVSVDDEPAHSAAPRPAGLRMDLDQAIAALPPGAREVFVLHDVEGYKHEEIAGMTGLAAGTSKAHLHRARRLLREHLQ
jgi:RNA polymerase sigma-70 factor (ECF subfamily)